MLSDFDAAIRTRFLVHLNQDMLYMGRHPANAQGCHDSAVSVVEVLSRIELISSMEKESLLAGVDFALMGAIKALRLRRGE